jgi:methyl-accepting chemotaxis protein
MIAAAILAVLLGIYLVKSFGIPLIKLRALMNEGERGNLAVRMDKIRGKDEIAQLGSSFNRMMEKITHLIQHTNLSAEQVLSSASELTNVSKFTATSSREISSASEQIAAGSSELAGQTEKVYDITVTNKEYIEQLVLTNYAMGKSANSVLTVSQQGSNYMKELIVRSNTTEEAARAGNAGKGFMVVADEIRKLANQSKDSINIVGGIINTIQREIKETVHVMSDVYPLFEEQIQSVKGTDQIFSEVKEQMSAFIQQLDSITKTIQIVNDSQQVLLDAMTNVSSVSEESSATSEEVASLTIEQIKANDGLVSLSESLDQLSKSLKNSLNEFQI